MKARPCLHSEAWIGFLQLQAARGHARAGERTRPAGIATNPRGPEEFWSQNDEARREPEGRCSRQWESARSVCDVNYQRAATRTVASNHARKAVQFTECLSFSSATQTLIA